MFHFALADAAIFGVKDSWMRNLSFSVKVAKKTDNHYFSVKAFAVKI